MLKLYAIAPSLYSAKVRICLRAKGLEWAEVPPPGGYGSAEYKALIPAGNIPALDADGLVIPDSEAINEFLDEKYPAPPMMPREARARAYVRACSRFHDTRLEPAVRALFAHVDPAGRNGFFIDRQAMAINERLEQFAQVASPAPLIYGEMLTLADCGYPVTFAVLDALAPVLNLDLAWPEPVRRYRDALGENDTVAAELVSYAPAFAGWIDKTTTSA